MLKLFITAIVCAGTLLSCNTETDTKKEGNAEEKEDLYFPVYAFLKEEIRKVDELPGGIKIYTTIHEQTDTSYINHEEFHRLCSPFVKEVLKPEEFKQQYAEKSFYDQSAGTANFLYEPKNYMNGISRIDVLTQTNNMFQETISLYMELNENDTLSKLLWQPGKEFQLNKAALNNLSETVTIRVVWDNFGG